MKNIGIVSFLLVGLCASSACVLSPNSKNKQGANDDCDRDGDKHTDIDRAECDGVGTNDDCDDGNGSMFPGAVETCDGQDNNCNGFADENGVCTATDTDGDRDPDITDCLPLNPAVGHGLAELCDGFDNNCNTVVDENCGGTGGTGGSASVPRKVVAHYRPGMNITAPIWVKGYLSGAGTSDGYVEALMNLWTNDGVGEVFVAPFVFPSGSKFEFWPESFQSNGNPIFIFDVCDKPNATMCAGKGNFCAVMYGGTNPDFWLTLDTELGPNVLWNAGTIADRIAGAPKYTENAGGDGLGLCTANGITPEVPKP